MQPTDMRHGLLQNKRIIILLLVSGGLLRIACCGKYVFMDESPILGNIVNFFENHTLLPTHFSYPTLFSYLVAIPTRLGALVLRLAGIIPSARDVWALFTLDSTLPVLPARCVSVAFGLATVLVVFEIGRRFFDIRVGIVAASILTFSRLHIDYSSYALPDAAMTFFCALSLFSAFCMYRTGLMRCYVLGGFAAGLAVSTKYNGIFIVLPLLFSHMMRMYSGNRLLSLRAWMDIRGVLAVLAFLSAFLVGSPGWLVEFRAFWGALSWERMHMAGGHLGSFGLPYVHHIVLLWSWEKTIAILFGAGLCYAVYRRKWQDVILLTLILPAYLVIGTWQKKDLHYLLFIYPPLALSCGKLFTDTVVGLQTRGRRLAAHALLIAALVWPACSSGLYAFEQTQEDTRWIALRWIQVNIEENARILADWAYLPKLLTPEEKTGMLEGKHREFYVPRIRHTRTYRTTQLVYSRKWLGKKDAGYLVTSSYCFERFFRTQPPSPGSGLFYEYNKRRETYEVLLHDPEHIGWRLLKEFHTRKGPRILLFVRETETDASPVPRAQLNRSASLRTAPR